MLKKFKKILTPREYDSTGGSLQNRFLSRFRIYMQKAISTHNQGPRSKIMSEKNQCQKPRVSVPLSLSLFCSNPNENPLKKPLLFGDGFY